MVIAGVVAKLLDRVARGLVLREPDPGGFGGGVEVVDQLCRFFMYAGECYQRYRTRVILSHTF